MDPNSAHQQWSEWVFIVTAPAHPPFQVAVDNLRRLATSLFGHAGRLQAAQTTTDFQFRLQIETSRESVTDPTWRERVRQQITAFVATGWKQGGSVRWVEPRLLAGNPEDGRPAAQWLILPDVASDLRVFGAERPGPVQTLGAPTMRADTRVW